MDGNPDIMSSLMMGDKIPLDVYEFIKKIANKEILTTDLYKTLNDYIKNRKNSSTYTFEESIEEVHNPTL